MKKLESHHGSRIGEHQGIRVAQKHLALSLADLKLQGLRIDRHVDELQQTYAAELRFTLWINVNSCICSGPSF